MKKTKENLNTEQTETSPQDVPETVENTEQTDDSEELDPVERLNNNLQEANDRFLRLYSEFDNYRKRSLKERLDLIKTASESVILSLLPVLDDFERALPTISDEATKSGIDLIYTKLKTTLESQGVKAMESKGVAFNADLHEAVAQIPTDDEAQKDKVIDEIQRGYYLNDKVIRHAKVAVAN